ncbi:protein kinase, putative [Leishmania panamensis]|uniref:non-specific serine/threonine protein kinase n=4 Tax=Viannia TaxID=37616 RepID=A0A088RQX9_LEIPA|nr:protein kinase, putative [Leishmania panamensis]AIN98378.1 protein kinase, putative [Leishmania panamensis]CCM15631.1 protein kinase, putative [Leishmania guyanensis]
MQSSTFLPEQRHLSSKSGPQNHHYVNPLVSSFPTVVGPKLPCKYRVRRAIGRGAFSTVWLLIDNKTGQTVVGKLSDASHSSSASKAFATAEVENMRCCSHPNIISLIENFEAGEKSLYILEYANAGDLQTQVDTRAQPPPGTNDGSPIPYREDEVLVIFAQLGLAIRYLHDHRIMHRDLKTSNVLLTRSGLIKLGDFGFSRQYQESVSGEVGNTFCGTPYYLAPEMWQRQPYSYKADIWSLGVIMYELLALRKPFQATNLSELMEMVTRQGSFDPLPEELYSSDMISLVKQMLKVNPSERPSINEILALPLFQQRGLRILTINVRRIKNLDTEVRARLVEDVGAVLGDNDISDAAPSS